jgi:hypothetical protein
MEETRGMDLERKIEEIRKAVLDLQKFFKAPGEELLVRSCTSCLADSCNKPLTSQSSSG